MLSKVINTLTHITKWIALVIMALMMLFITFAVISRMIITPIIGDVELVQLGMVVLIMCGLSYTQYVDGHISIGLLVDKFPVKTQKILDIFASLMTFIVTMVIGIVFIGVAFNHKNHMQLSSGLLDIPYYPFDFIIVIGFLLWGLEALLKLVRSILAIFQPTEK